MQLYGDNDVFQSDSDEFSQQKYTLSKKQQSKYQCEDDNVLYDGWLQTMGEQQILEKGELGLYSGTQIISAPTYQNQGDCHYGKCIIKEGNLEKIQKRISKQGKVLPGSNKNTAKSLSTHFQNFLKRIFKNSRDPKIKEMEMHPNIQAFLSKKISGKKELLEIIQSEGLQQFASEFFENLKWLRGVLNGNKSSFLRIDECFAENQEYIQVLVNSRNSSQ